MEYDDPDRDPEERAEAMREAGDHLRKARKEGTIADQRIAPCALEYGDRVRLLPFEEEPEELGTVVGGLVNGNYTVRVDDEYRHHDDAYDDGLRDVPAEQLVREEV
jgi:hypothetical protein